MHTPSCHNVAVAGRHFSRGSLVFTNVFSYNKEVSPTALLTAAKDGAQRIEHSATPNSMVVESSVVTTKDIAADEKITININFCVFKIEPPIPLTDGTTLGGFSALNEKLQQETLHLADAPVRQEAYRHGLQVQSSTPMVSIVERPGLGMATYSRGIRKGSTIFKCNGIALPFPTMYTLGIRGGKHLLFQCDAQCLAHSCDPNVRIILCPNSDSFSVEALRDIAPGELIAFNYTTSEWDMNTPFACLCGAAQCSKMIRGFKHLGDADRQRLWPLATAWVQEQTLATGWQPPMLMASEGTVTLLDDGAIAAHVVTAPGSVLFDVGRYEIAAGLLKIDELSLPHSCDATAVFVEGRIVARRALAPGDRITVDLALMAFELAAPFECCCGAAACRGTVRGFCALDDEAKDALMNLAEPCVRSDATQRGYEVRSSSPYVAIRANGSMGQATFASQPIARGTTFFHTEGLLLPFPTMYTILLDEGKHLLFAGGAQCLAHSCDPNVQVLVDPSAGCFDVVALRDIAAGELIAFNYLTTEWDMNTPFPCLCGAARCSQMIRGYAHLNADECAAIASQATPAIKRLAAQRAKGTGHTVLSNVDSSQQNCGSKLQRNGCVAHEDLILTSPKGHLKTAAGIARGVVLVDCKGMTLSASTLRVGSCCIEHSGTANTVLVEGRLVTAREVQCGETLTVNMNYFVYDMEELVGDAVSCGDGPRGFKYLNDSEKQRVLYLCEPPVRARAMKDGFTVKSTSPLLCVRPNGEMGQTAYATAPIRAGTTLFHATGLLVPFVTMYTICVGKDRHLLFGDAAECIAHHCDPNVRIVLNADNTFDMVTIRDIECDEMVTFNYTTSEWDMNTPFACLCGAAQCSKMIRGFKHLGDADRQRLWPLATAWVQQQALCVK